MANWHSTSIHEVMEDLKSGREGITQAEAEARLLEYGGNQLPEQKKTHPLVRLILQFNNVLIYVLLGAAVVTGLMKHWIDTFVILGVVVVNAFIGFIQEGKAEKALEGIRRMMSLTAMVIRDGRRVDAGRPRVPPAVCRGVAPPGPAHRGAGWSRGFLTL
ncbi:MAG: cation-transporting P-type ATPase [Clostridia bacterium]